VRIHREATSLDTGLRRYDEKVEAFGGTMKMWGRRYAEETEGFGDTMKKWRGFSPV